MAETNKNKNQTNKNETSSSHQRGGSSDQHAKTGKAGGSASHTCRGQECNKSSSNNDQE